MKKILILTSFILYAFTTSFGQAQQHVWYLQDQEIDFTTDIPTISSISPEYGAGGSGEWLNVGNGIHDSEGNKLFSVYNSKVTSSSGIIGYLNHMDWQVDGADIIPKPGSSCGYYIVYSSTLQSLCIDCEGYCGNGNSAYNKFYTEVDMSLNFGQGEFVGTNGIELSACIDNNPNPIAVSRELTDGNRYLYLLSDRQIKRFLVSSSGINFQEVIGEYAYLSDVESIELELSADGTKLACTDFSGDKVYVFHLDPVTGTIDPTAGNNGDGTSDFSIPTISTSLTGLEFSQNGFNLYVGSRGEGIYHITIPTGSVDYLEGSESYGNTQLELAYHPSGMHKIYGVSYFDADKLGYIDNPGAISPTFIPDAYDGISAYDDEYMGVSITSVSRLPNQIDGEDYVERFDHATGSCCATTEGFDAVEYIATGSATWTPFDNPFGDIESVKIAQELRIPNGVTIEIQDMEFLFYEGSKVVVEQGGKLTLRNSVFSTSDCDGLLWKGIQLWGNTSEPQSYSKQGWLIMHNSTIEHAHIAVDTWNPGNWSQTGGVIMAYNSTFRNNRRAVAFMSYVHTVGADIEVANKSLFRNSFFIWDNEFRAKPLNHVSLYRVTGVKFAGCHFSDDRTGVNFTSPYLDDGNITKCGIRSIDAKYYVNAACNTMDISGCGDDIETEPWNPSKFTNLDFGIYATNSSSIYPIDVKRSIFTNNLNGIYTYALNTPKIVLNKFYYTNFENYYTTNDKFGVHLYYTQNIIVEQNEFLNTSGAGIGLCMGILCSNLGQNNEMIRKNEFHDMYIGNLTEGENRGVLSPGYPAGSVGLSFECNDNSLNTTDFKILPTLEDDFGAFNGVKLEIGNFEQSAGNTFSDWGLLHFDNQTSHILKYFWEDVVDQEPITTINVNKYETPYGNACPSNYPISGNIKETYAQLKYELQYLMQQYDGYVNQGIQPPSSLESKVINVSTELSQTSNLILASLYNEDDSQLDLNLVEQWIQMDDDFFTEMRLIDLYIQKLDFAMAQVGINNLNASISSATPQHIIKQIKNFVKLKNVIIPALSQQNTLANMSESDKTKVRAIAVNGEGIAKNQARELLCFFYEECDHNLPSIGQNSQNMYSFEDESTSFDLTQPGISLEEESTISSIEKVFPNPTSNNITLMISGISEVYNIEVYSAQGEMIKNLETREKETVLDLSNLEKGVYFIKATNGSNSFVKRILKM